MTSLTPRYLLQSRPPLDPQHASREWLMFVVRHLPLRRGRDRVFVSVEMYTMLSPHIREGCEVDLNLRGVEMRHEQRTSRR